MKRLQLHLLSALLLAACTAPALPSERHNSSSSTLAVSSVSSTSQSAPAEPLGIYSKDRITKKPFGIYITPESSPVQPEVFTGYHTGTDYEVLPGENEEEIAVPAICTGPLIYRNWVQGYGGVGVQRCQLHGKTVTVLYGHMDSNTLVPIETLLSTGAVIGYLGKGYSDETSGERPHLHLSIHRGEVVELKGYVSTESATDHWLDASDYTGSGQ